MDHGKFVDFVLAYESGVASHDEATQFLKSNEGILREDQELAVLTAMVTRKRRECGVQPVRYFDEN